MIDTTWEREGRMAELDEDPMLRFKMDPATVAQYELDVLKDAALKIGRASCRERV